MKRGRIKSFTLIEMVLAMMLAAIVIGMAYTAFTLFSRLYGGYSQKNLAHADTRLFKQTLDKDIEKATLVSIEEGRLNFQDAAGLVSLSYVPGPDYLIRIHNALPDTFKLKGLTMQVSFENQEASQAIVDHVVFRFLHDKVPTSVSFVKTYTSSELFNYQDSLWNR
jgi:hypothetical protein